MRLPGVAGGATGTAGAALGIGNAGEAAISVTAKNPCFRHWSLKLRRETVHGQLLRLPVGDPNRLMAFERSGPCETPPLPYDACRLAEVHPKDRSKRSTRR